jgi:hypothetical protein
MGLFAAWLFDAIDATIYTYAAPTCEPARDIPTPIGMLSY